jgi:putative spermidine/putrescine transport system permease protein
MGGPGGSTGWLVRLPIPRLTWLWIPAILYLVLFFLIPTGAFLLKSVFDPELTLRHFARLADSPAFRIVLWNTFRISALVTLACLVIGIPTALRIVTMRRAPASIIMAVLALSVWTSLLVRNYAWLVLLGREGLVSVAFVKLGIFSEKRSLLFNEAAVVIAMTHVLLPYMVIPTVAALRSIDPAAVRAAENLGARPLQVLGRVVLPLGLPGIATGALLVFVLSLGFYVTPAVMGGRGQTMLTMLMEVEINEQLNWGYAAANAVVLVVVTAMIFALYRQRFALDRLWGGGGA